MEVFDGHHDRLRRAEKPSGECRQKPFALLLGGERKRWILFVHREIQHRGESCTASVDFNPARDRSRSNSPSFEASDPSPRCAKPCCRMSAIGYKGVFWKYGEPAHSIQ